MALRKRESKLFDRIKKNIKNIHFTRIESSTINGIPDVHGVGLGKYQALSQGAIETYSVKSFSHTLPKLVKVHSTPDPVPVSRWDEIRAILIHY
jgi:hypothetical protein